MRMPQDTPAQWFLVCDEPDCVSTVGKNDLVDLQDNQFIDCNTEANAYLVAAALEMLKALELLVRWDECGIPHPHTSLYQARAAIAKAKFRGG